MRYLTILILTLLSFFLHAQNTPVFFQSNLVEVFDENDNQYKNGLAGGLKFPLFGDLDLDFDGYRDIVILDRADDRLLTFLNDGKKDTVSFTYRPVFEADLPDIKRLLMFKDYNKDGLPDLFTFSKKYNSGLEVYKNVSTADETRFVKVSEQLQAWYWGNEGLIYLSSIDVPALKDVDGDGDMDIVTFSLLGYYMDLFQNVSVEKYGVIDSLEFEYASQCWGKVQENDTSNQLYLGRSCSPVKIDGSVMPDEKHGLRGTRHAGSTLYLKDMDLDGDMDLLLGDVEYPAIALLENGKADFNYPEDSMIAQSFDFPKGTKKVRIQQMPALFFMDLNNDGINDFIASPQDEEIIDTFEGFEQVWMYLGKESATPSYTYQTSSFLQDEMVDLGGPTSPAFIDIDLDGDQDLVVATQGNFKETFYQHDYLVLFENIGNPTKAVFKVKDRDYLNFSAKKYQNLTIHFGDIDSDGDPDLLFGKEDGRIGYYENTAAQGQPPQFTFRTNFLDNIDVGDVSSVCVVDLDKDGLPDLLIGERYGNINHYRQVTNQLDFVEESDTFGGIRFKIPERESSVPVVADLDQNGLYDLLLGTRNGYFYLYPDIEDNYNRKFDVVTELVFDSVRKKYVERSLGRSLKPAVAFLDGDNKPDILTGSKRGGLLLFGSVYDSVLISVPEEFIEITKPSVYPNPAKDYVLIDLKKHFHNAFVEVYDIYGRLQIKRKFSSQKYQLNLRGLKHGIYLVRISLPGQQQMFCYKIIKSF